MLQNAVQFAGDSLPATKITIVNRTGANLLVGGVYALDIAAADAATVSTRDKMCNVIAVSADNIDGILVVAENALPDNEVGYGVVMGPVNALVDGGTTDVASGDRLKAVAGSTSLVKASDAAGSLDVAVGKAFDSNTGTAALKLVYFMGLNLNINQNAAA